MLVSAHIAAVSDTLRDVNNVTWTKPNHVAFLNDAIRALVLVRPDASSVTADMTLAPGTRQELAAGELRLIRVVRNMGTDGSTPGKAVRLGSMDSLDAFNPDWHTATAATAIREYMYDEARPDEFWVSPPVHATIAVHVQVMKSVLPAEVTGYGGSDVLPVDDIYAPALREWCTYLAFSRDSEKTPNWQRAARHFAAFFNTLQIKMQADMAINPKVRAMAEKQS